MYNTTTIHKIGVYFGDFNGVNPQNIGLDGVQWEVQVYNKKNKDLVKIPVGFTGVYLGKPWEYNGDIPCTKHQRG